MGTDTSGSDTMEDVATSSRNFRIPNELYSAALDTAKAGDEKVPAVVIRALRAYVANPQSFNVAVAAILAGVPLGLRLAAPTQDPTP